LTDTKRFEGLHVGIAIEENDPLDELVGMLHFLDGFLAPLPCKRFVAPIIQQAVMQPILIHCGELVAQRLVYSITLGLPFMNHSLLPIAADA